MIEGELLGEFARVCDSLTPPVRWLHLTMVRWERCPWLAGPPDLVLVGSLATAWREVQAGSTVLTTVQADWLDRLEAAGSDVAIWTELDLAHGVIRQKIQAPNGVLIEREPWIPGSASAAETAHRQATYGN